MKLDCPCAKGSTQTVREQLNGFKEVYGDKFNDPRLDLPPCPQEFQHIWTWFREIGGDFGWPQIESWANVTNRKLHRFEISLIVQLNNQRAKLNGN